MTKDWGRKTSSVMATDATGTSVSATDATTGSADGFKVRWLFIGSVYPKSWEEKFEVGSSPTIDVQRSLLAALARMGWKPDAILTTPPIRRFPHDGLQKFPKETAGEIEGFPGVPLVSLGWTNLEPFKTTGIAAQLKRYLADWTQRVRVAGEEPKVLIYNLGPTHEQGGFLAGVSRSLKLPMVPFVTDLDFSGGKKWSPSSIRFCWQVRLLNACERVAALNANVIKDFSANKPSLTLSGIVPDQGFFEKLLELPAPEKNENQTVFLYSGSLNRPRGILRLLEAFENLPNDQAKLVITGRGPDQTLVEEAARKNPKINYRGFLQTESERLAVIREADVLVNPHEIKTPEARYLFPSKLAEYLASGRLVVSSNLPGMKKFPVEEMVLYGEDSADTLAAAMSSAMKLSAEERWEKGARAREWAKTHFDWDRIAGELFDFIEGRGSSVCATDTTLEK